MKAAMAALAGKTVDGKKLNEAVRAPWVRNSVRHRNGG